VKLRLPDDVLESGDLGIHDEEAYPSEHGIGLEPALGGRGPSDVDAPPLRSRRPCGTLIPPGFD
jgi:Amt family ammonium transporter